MMLMLMLSAHAGLCMAACLALGGLATGCAGTGVGIAASNQGAAVGVQSSVGLRPLAPSPGSQWPVLPPPQFQLPVEPDADAAPTPAAARPKAAP